MCGIAGILNAADIVDPRLLNSFTKILRHRGPDDSGTYINSKRSVGFAQTRLSILDLSPAGHQPMSTADGRYTIVFNGEIYNYRKLKAQLESQGIRFCSDSDTEVLLYLFATHREDFLAKLEGMFSFAIWDEVEQTCFLARDPLGIKPLYYWQSGTGLAFASEIRTLLSADLGPKKIDYRSVAEYLLFGSVPEPGTIVEGIRALPAGNSMTWKNGKIKLQSYWEPSYGTLEISCNEAVKTVRDALDESVQRHLVSDVPVGIFLSGGIDSTALVALSKAAGAQDIQTFCMSFDEQEFNEGDLAARTASHFGTRHHDWRLSAKEGHVLLAEFLSTIDSPSNDGFNTFCISKFAKDNGLKVVLSGLGGDELFGSYPSYQKIPRILATRAHLGWAKLCHRWMGILMERAGSTRLKRLGVYLQSEDGPLSAYWAMRGFFTPQEVRTIIRKFYGAELNFDPTELLHVEIPAQPTVQDTVSYLETTRYMRHQLLRDSDVFSMAHGLELRVPLVDRKLIDVVNSIRASQRLESGKKLFCSAVPELPPWVATAPKRGFRVPFQDWVNSQWNEAFIELERKSPVVMGSWYRKWTLFTLENFLQVNGIEPI